MKVRPEAILQEGEKEIQQSHRCICIDRQYCWKRLREVQGGNSLEKDCCFFIHEACSIIIRLRFMCFVERNHGTIEMNTRSGLYCDSISR